MKRFLPLVVVFLLGALLGVGVLAGLRPVPNNDQIRAIAETVVAENPAPVVVPPPALDADQILALVEDHLVKTPSILARMTSALQSAAEQEKANKTKATIAEMRDAIFASPNHAVIGNTDGDITLVELFDYNCGYCRQALPDLVALLEEDTGIKLILKEFPILSQGSMDAARVAVQVAANPEVDYWAFYQRLYSTRGQIDRAAALNAAASLGLDPAALQAGMNSDVVATELKANYAIAEKLGITGTPTFILGDSVIAGAVGVDALRAAIKNMRACGAITCETD
jgi:protein-disulfide isomerase